MAFSGGVLLQLDDAWIAGAKRSVPFEVLNREIACQGYRHTEFRGDGGIIRLASGWPALGEEIHGATYEQDERIVFPRHADSIRPEYDVDERNVNAITKVTSAIGLAAVLGAVLMAADRAPTPEEQERFLAATRERALEYSQSLPDFICTQQIYRSMKRGMGAWREVDRLTVRLSFSSRGEQYTLLQVNGAATSAGYDSVLGSTSRGEFGSLLRGVFESDSGTQFRFERWVRRDRRPAALYSFRIPQGSASHSVLAFRDG
jgi:hypothetical protein